MLLAKLAKHWVLRNFHSQAIDIALIDIHIATDLAQCFLFSYRKT